MGLARISIGLIERDMPLWARMQEIAASLTTVALTGIVAISPVADFSTILLFLQIMVIANGFARTSRGYVGV